MRIGLMLTVPAEHLDRVPLESLQEAGLWALFLRCFEDEVRWQAPAVANFAERVAQTPLRLFLVPAGYGGLLAGEQQPSSLFLRVHPDTRQVDNRGRRVPKACPNHPRYLEWVTSSLRTLAWLIDADGVVWEEPGFHFARGVWACRCRYCQELFAGRHQASLPAELNEVVVAFRQQCIGTLLTALSTAVKSVDARLACLVLPTPAAQMSAIPTGNENWRLLAANEKLDGLILTWPPAFPPQAGLGGVVGFYTAARTWLGPQWPGLLRLVASGELGELELALKQLAHVGIGGVVVEDVAPLVGPRGLTRRGASLLAVLRWLAD
jgi:hypothetical protein